MITPSERKLIAVGLSPKEAKVYITLLGLGTQPASSVARRASLSRSTAFFILKELIEKGLVHKYLKEDVNYFTAESPDKLKVYLKKQTEVAKKREKELSTIAPFLKGLYDPTTSSPKIRYYEGLSGLKRIFLDTIKDKKELLAFHPIHLVPPELDDWLENEFVPLRVNSKIFIHMAVSDKELGIEAQKKDAERLRKTYIIPKQYRDLLQSDIVIYGNNKVSICSYAPNEELGVVIESDAIHNTFKGLFNMAIEPYDDEAT